MSNKDSPRMRKVNEILREAIADECQSLKDPRIGFLTITGVETAPDLRNATVFYSVLGDEADDAAEALASAAPRIRAAVGAQVRMKYVPKLSFAVDPSIEYGQRISTILRSIEHQDEPALGGGGGAEATGPDSQEPDVNGAESLHHTAQDPVRGEDEHGSQA